MRWVVLFLLIGPTACTTITGRDLPVIKRPSFDTREKRSIIISSPRSKYLMDRKKIKDYFLLLNIFQSVEIVDEFEYVSEDTISPYDIHIEMDFISGGFFEPYCLIFLTIIPCTPPIEWALGVKIDGKSGAEKNYLLKERATQVTWALGPLLPGFGKEESKMNDLQINLLNNLILKLKNDGMI